MGLNLEGYGINIKLMSNTAETKLIKLINPL